MELDNEYKEEVYLFLNELRDSGVTNMFGAATNIQDEFGFPIDECRAWLTQWMEDF